MVKSVEFNQKVSFLQDTSPYPEPTGSVETIETHMSWIFLTDKYAYKLKKPVKYSFLDFSTLELRRASARREIELNSRLAPETYIKVATLSSGDTGELTLEPDEQGNPVDYLVKMHRLPEDRMLDRLIEENNVDMARVERASGRLNRFYRKIQPEKISGEVYYTRIRNELLNNFSTLKEMKSYYTHELIYRNYEILISSLDSMLKTIEARAAEGRILEGHGDLKPDHICLVDNPVIFDCLEFNKKLRTVDPLDEFAYLKIECERKGKGEVADVFLERYCKEMNDHCEDPLFHFYKAKRAYLRARLSAAHLEEEQYDRSREWIEKTDWYLKKCRKELEEL